jgi:hypothetical protein
MDALQKTDGGRLAVQTPPDPRSGATRLVLDPLEWIQRIPHPRSGAALPALFAFPSRIEMLILCLSFKQRNDQSQREPWDSFSLTTLTTSCRSAPWIIRSRFRSAPGEKPIRPGPGGKSTACTSKTTPSSNRRRLGVSWDRRWTPMGTCIAPIPAREKSSASILLETRHCTQPGRTGPLYLRQLPGF